jgi:hypothetical protein
MSSVDFEECAHKLMKIQLQEGEEVGCGIHYIGYVAYLLMDT